MLDTTDLISYNELMKPQFEHDCDNCEFLGHVIINDEGADLYYCAREPTVIARRSSDGPDYSSGMDFGRHGFNQIAKGGRTASQHLVVAYTIAKLHGWNVNDDKPEPQVFIVGEDDDALARAINKMVKKYPDTPTL